MPPGARKGLSPQPDRPATNGQQATPSAAALAASAQAADPSIISINSRLPVPASGTSRIPSTTAAAAAAAAGTDKQDKSNVASLEGSFRQFVSSERQRLTEKKQALVKAAERQDKDSKLASLLEFSQNFKVSWGAMYLSGDSLGAKH